MGVYVFEWTKGSWFKVGHYSKQNPWSRFANRGWNSVIVPDEFIRDSSIDDFRLVYWSPSLGTSQEKALHKLFDAHTVGEWYPGIFLEPVVNVLKAVSPDHSVSCDKQAAVSSRRRL